MNVETAIAPTIRGRIAAIGDEALMRLALKLDALVTGANGVAYLALAGVLDGPLGIDAAVLRPIGAFLVAFALGVWLVGSRATVNRTAVRAVIAANVVWAADSVIVLAAGWTSPTAVGGVWIALQAVVVAGFAALQATSLRRCR